MRKIEFVKLIMILTGYNLKEAVNRFNELIEKGNIKPGINNTYNVNL